MKLTKISFFFWIFFVCCFVLSVVLKDNIVPKATLALLFGIGCSWEYSRRFR